MANGDHADDARPRRRPAGLTAGYLLGKRDRDVVVLEAEDQVGGLAKTVERDGYRFDLGGHRFFTKALEVDDLWHEVLGDEFLRGRACRASTGTTGTSTIRCAGRT